MNMPTKYHNLFFFFLTENGFTEDQDQILFWKMKKDIYLHPLILPCRPNMLFM